MERSSTIFDSRESGVSPEVIAALETADRIAAQLPAIIYVLDAQSNLIWLSKDWECLTGRTFEETRTHGLDASIHPDDVSVTSTKRTRILEWHRNSTLPQEPLSLTYRIRSQCGRIASVVDRLTPAKSDSGDTVGFIGVLVEIGESPTSPEPKRNAVLQALSKREVEVANLLTAGVTNRVAAKQMGISVRTVEAHRARLMKKLGIRSIVELVRLPLQSQKSRHRKAAR